jgi:hypothetical protein
MAPSSDDPDRGARAGSSAPDLDRIRAALRADRTIDIVTIGARTGRPRTTELWFVNVAGRIIICGTPSANGTPGPRQPRDWLANMLANPDFLFCLKESVCAQLTARAVPVRDPKERRALMTAPETAWYRDRVSSVDELVARSPIVEVIFTGAFQALNR